MTDEIAESLFRECFDYRAMDTSGATHASDEEVLSRIRHLNLIGKVPGYAWVAELCKRYERLIAEQK